jgi:hypothetical protein
MKRENPVLGGRRPGGGLAAAWQKCTSFAPHIPEKSTDAIACSVNIMEGTTCLNTIVRPGPTNESPISAATAPRAGEKQGAHGILHMT